MATRMQQRRGTAAQWTAANPVLAAGEIGFETDTNKFKVGNGSTAWTSLTYFVDASVAFDSDEVTAAIEAAIGNVIGLAPNTLDTLEELALAVGSNPTFANNISNDIAQIQNTLSQYGNSISGLSDADDAMQNSIADHENATTNVHGIVDTSDLVVSADIANFATQSEMNNAVSVHSDETTGVHGIANTAVLVVQNDLSTAISNHNAETANVHGIANTAALATMAYANEAAANAQSAAESYADTELDVHVGYTTNVHGISDTSQLAYLNAANQTFTGNMEVDGNFVVDGNFTVNGSNTLVSATQIQIEDTMLQLGHENSGNTTDLGLIVSYNDGTQKHSGLVKDVSDGKWKLFDDVTVEPSTTVDFTSGGLDVLAVGALESANAITASGGITFSDGTQTKEGVPSRTTIIQKTSSYTLSNLNERDSVIEMGSASALTLTIPADSSVNFPVGTSLDILQTGAGQVTIAGAGGVTVNATPGLKMRTQWSGATLFKRGADLWVVYGDLSA